MRRHREMRSVFALSPFATIENRRQTYDLFFAATSRAMAIGRLEFCCGRVFEKGKVEEGGPGMMWQP